MLLHSPLKTLDNICMKNLFEVASIS